MRCFNILKFNRIGRAPKLMLGVGMVALALVASGGATAKRASASSTTSYRVEVTWDHVTWSDINDGLFDNNAEVYGLLYAENRGLVQGSFGLTYGIQYRDRLMGNYGNDSCTVGWTGTGPCNKKVYENTPYFFSQTPLSASRAENQPATNYSYYNNKVYLDVYPGNTLNFQIGLKDYDSGSADDNMCELSATGAFSEAQLQTLNMDLTLSPISGVASDGKCVGVVHLRRI